MYPAKEYEPDETCKLERDAGGRIGTISSGAVRRMHQHREADAAPPRYRPSFGEGCPTSVVIGW